MTSEEIQTLIQPFVERIGGLMHALRHITLEYGYIDSGFIPAIADVFNLSQAEIRGVISFYHDFRTEPPAKHRVRICQAEACQALGTRKLISQVEEHLNLSMGQASKDGAVELKPVYCLGLCSVGPSMEIDGQLIGRASLDHVRGVIE